MEGELAMSDRLAAELFQIVNEGMSNIRKHTSARHGLVRIKCANGWVNIRIENECTGAQVGGFMPRSIAERADALGGKVRVEQGGGGTTAVHIEILV
jgi:signal transduction histidine kinase